jgi:outer membrane protein OmpA-like peptidoglycan-associated protein
VHLALPLLLAAIAPATADEVMMHPSLPSRATTYVVDDLLTSGPVENFREVFVDPAALGAKLKPSAAPKVPRPEGAVGVGPSIPGKASLPISNISSSYAEIEINGDKIGIIGPLTSGAIHGVRSGTYAVTFTLQNGYTVTKKVGTMLLDKPIVPGGIGAKASLDEGWVPSWADDPKKGYVKAPPPPKPKKVKKVRRARLVGKKIEFDGRVLFDTGSGDILAESNGLLDDMAAVILENDKVTLIEVQGHTDNRGAAAGNLTLSQTRAASVVTYLVGKGIAAERLEAKGYGEDKPRAEGEDEAAWAANRRVELHVMKQAPTLLPPPGADDAPKPATREGQKDKKKGGGE